MLGQILSTFEWSYSPVLRKVDKIPGLWKNDLRLICQKKKKRKENGVGLREKLVPFQMPTIFLFNEQHIVYSSAAFC